MCQTVMAMVGCLEAIDFCEASNRLQTIEQVSFVIVFGQFIEAMSRAADAVTAGSSELHKTV
jgi:hypothetical protein